MSTERTATERTVGLTVAALLVASTVVVPLLHAGAVRPGPAFADAGAPQASWIGHDHAVCLQLQGSTARPATPSPVPLLPARVAGHSVPLRTSASGDDGRLLLRARSPPGRPRL